MELKRQRTNCSDEYAWTDYMSLPFTQNVSLFFSQLQYAKSVAKTVLFSISIGYIAYLIIALSFIYFTKRSSVKLLEWPILSMAFGGKQSKT